MEILLAEMINGKVYKYGTINEIKEKKYTLVKEKFPEIKKEIDILIENSFSKMEKNVDKFLDWYYSLGAEYLRIVGIFTGNLEEIISKKFTEILLENRPFDELNQYIFNLDKNVQNEILLSLEKEIPKILNKNEIKEDDLKGKKVIITKHTSLEEILKFSHEDFKDIIDFKERLIASSGVTAAGGIAGYTIAKKITTTIVNKGIVKSLSKYILKIAGKKAAVKTVFVAIGSTVGSIIPGIGTITGGILGGIVAGVVTDKVLLEVEESLNREKLKKEIIEIIRKKKEQLKKTISQQTLSKLNLFFKRDILYLAA
ncbi:MAG: hypothetical protein GXO21_00210 [Aquificae bacterium]|nr:hypothetical protein [Aquificota bacterium]